MTDLSMFRYLTRDVPQTQTDMDLIYDFAKTAAKSYLGPSQTPLNLSIEKIAQSNRLSPDQVNMLCQEANKEVHVALFDRSQDKYTVFDLADPAAVISNLSGGQVKTASENRSVGTDYNLSPSEHTESPDFIVAGSKGHQGLKDMSSFHKKASFEKLSYELDHVLKDRLLLEDQMNYLDKQFVKIARSHLIQYPLHTRAEQYPLIVQFSKEAGLNSADNKRVMEMLHYVMIGQGLMEKTAEVPVDDEYIDYDLNARIVNGNHPLEAIVKTMEKNRQNQNILSDRANVIQDTLNENAPDGRNGGAVIGYEKVRNL